ncbi:MAG TPA: patatin-like phospholipase family protein [Thermoleophilaceae bacterium]|nr:patatin-like phospholipase family protein [Thermoleophilaceae bacterium]
MAERVRVLAIDGGGIRGIIPALVLADVERRTGRSTAELFDLVAGTSTGAILACALTLPEADGRTARWRAEQLVDIYECEGRHIFSRSLLWRIRSLDGLIAPKYRATGLESALERYLGDGTLADALSDLLITAYDTEGRNPVFFRPQTDGQLAMRAVAHASSAAPTYFAPVELSRPGDGHLSLIDGGVFAANPTMVAVAQVLHDRPGAELVMVSLGTGSLTRSLPFDRVRHWGLLQWARPLVDVVFDGVSVATDDEAGEIVGRRYWRLQTVLTTANDDLDDASRRNLEALRHQGEALVRERAGDIDAACAALTA